MHTVYFHMQLQRACKILPSVSSQHFLRVYCCFFLLSQSQSSSTWHILLFRQIKEWNKVVHICNNRWSWTHLWPFLRVHCGMLSSSMVQPRRIFISRIAKSYTRARRLGPSTKQPRVGECRTRRE